MNEIEGLLARENIRHQLALYCQGVDNRDWDLVRSCFADEHQHHHAPFEGSADEFIGFAKTVMNSISVSHHSVANIAVTIGEDGHSATSDANFTAIHFIEAADGDALSFATPGMDMDWIVAGSYSDRWILRDGKWLIVRRTSIHHWDRIEPSAPTG